MYGYYLCRLPLKWAQDHPAVWMVPVPLSSCPVVLLTMGFVGPKGVGVAQIHRSETNPFTHNSLISVFRFERHVFCQSLLNQTLRPPSSSHHPHTLVRSTDSAGYGFGFRLE